VTPSGVPQNEPQFIVVPRLPNSISYTEEGNLPEPHRMSHDLVHSTGLLKPPRLQPRVATCYPNTSYTRNWGPSKASPHDLHPKRCKNPPCDPTLHPKPPSAPLTSLGGTWIQTDWQTPHVAMRHTFSKAFTRSFPPGGVTLSAGRHAFQASLVFPYHLAAHPKSPSNTPQAARRHTSSVTGTCFWHFEASFKEPQALYIQSIT